MAQTVGSRSTDEERLAELGYKQELTRAWSGFSNFAIAFHDHPDPGRVLHDLRPSVEQRRPRRDLVGLAPDLDRDPDHRLLHVGATFSVIWVAIITVIFSLPFTPAAVPFNDEFSWNSVNYSPIMAGGLFLVVGAWWLLSARHTFKGPVRTVEFDAGLGIADPEQERVG